MFLGLRTVIYPVRDLKVATAWFTALVGAAPYFEEPFYVGFEVGGYELGLLPAEHDNAMADGPLTYWGVGDVDAAVARLLEAGATVHTPVEDVGGGIRVATVREPEGNIVGVIENPVFALPDQSALPTPDGPGR